MTSLELRQQRAKLVADARKIYEKAEAEKRSPLAEEQEQFDKLMAESDKLAAQANSLDSLERTEAELRASTGRVSENRIVEGTQEQGDLLRSDRYQAAFRSYLKSGHYGMTTEERASVDQVKNTPEYRNLQANIDVQGGFLVAPQQFVEKLIIFVNDFVFIRKDATKFTIRNAASLGVPSLDTDMADSDWTGELSTGSEDSSLAFGKRELAPKPLAKRIRISNKLLRMTELAEETVFQRLAYKIGISEEKAFMTGDGQNKPLGLFTADANGIPTSQDVTSGTSSVVKADDIIATFFNLKQQYQMSKSLRWVMHRSNLQIVRQFKDQNNQYLWQPAGFGSNLDYGRPDSLLGVPVYMSEYAPNTYSSGNYFAGLFDLKHYYIADALNVTIQRLQELYAETNQTGFIARLELDGMPVLAQAFTRLKIQ